MPPSSGTVLLMLAQVSVLTLACSIFPECLPSSWGFEFPCLPCLPTAVPPRPSEIWSPALIEIYIKEGKPTCFIHFVNLVIWHKILVDLGKGHNTAGIDQHPFPADPYLALSSLSVSLYVYLYLPDIILHIPSRTVSHTLKSLKLSSTPRQIFQVASSEEYELISLKGILENTTSSRHITWWCKLYRIRELTGYSFP